MKNSGATEDGEYLLHVSKNCKDPVKIYCHGLSGNEPKEYVSLPAGLDRNFAIVYDRRLPTSPVSARFQCDGTTGKKLYSEHGKTYFTKLRLNVDQLTVVTDDYQFADTLPGETAVPYGTAGDCFSMNPGNCRKGSFSINLTDTDLKVKDDVKWKNHGYPSDIQIQEFSRSDAGSVISAKCGGWCGRCAPTGPLILKHVCAIPESKLVMVLLLMVVVMEVPVKTWCGRVAC